MAVDKELLSYYQSLGSKFDMLPANASAETRRVRYVELTVDLPDANLNGLITNELSIDLAGRSLKAKTYSPQSHKSSKLLVFFHGGGWVIGSIASHESVCADLARMLGVTVLSVDYRLAPEWVYPAAHDDAVDVVRWAASQLLSFGCAELMVGGDSAGANLAAHASYILSGDDTVSIAAQYLIYPVVQPDFKRASYLNNAMGPGLTSADMQWYWRTYCPKPGTLDQMNNPSINLMAQDWKKPAPPTVLITAGHDPLCDEGLAYAHYLAEQGTSMRLLHAPDMTHGFIRLGATSARVRYWFAQMALAF